MDQTISKLASELDATVRAWLVESLGRPLADGDQVQITVRGADEPDSAAPQSIDESARLAPQVRVQAAIAEAIEEARSPNF
jgi:hypothetical protein